MSDTYNKHTNKSPTISVTLILKKMSSKQVISHDIITGDISVAQRRRSSIAKKIKTKWPQHKLREASVNQKTILTK